MTYDITGSVDETCAETVIGTEVDDDFRTCVEVFDAADCEAIVDETVREIVEDGDVEKIEEITREIIGDEGDDLPMLRSAYVFGDEREPVLIFNSDFEGGDDE